MAPFRSKAQRRYLFANHPDIAERWDAETGDKKLPERIHPDKHQRAANKLKRAMHKLANGNE